MPRTSITIAKLILPTFVALVLPVLAAFTLPAFAADPVLLAAKTALQARATILDQCTDRDQCFQQARAIFADYKSQVAPKALEAVADPNKPAKNVVYFLHSLTQSPE